MSEELKSVTAAECFEEFYGVDGDGLGQGEMSCQEELEHDFVAWSQIDDALMSRAKPRA